MPTSEDLLDALRALHPSSIDLSLERMRRLLSRLGDPQHQLPNVIHVAGTNGKGSVVALIAAMLAADGRRVHSYVSPAVGGGFAHCIQPGSGGPIAEPNLVDVLSRVLAANDGQPLTSFEGETAAALLVFAETPADAVVLETGMGGRLDATNVVARPVLTVITPIGLDHTEFLGPTLAAIATEKAGIMRSGVPCIVGPQQLEALDQLENIAGKLRTPLIIRGRDFDCFEQHGRLVFQDGKALLDLPLPALKGRHQVSNAGVAVAAVRQMGVLAPSDAAIGRGLTAVRWPGRLQLLRTGPLAALLPAGSELWLDGAHNADAATALARFMAEQEERQPLPLHLVVGMLTTKDPAAFLQPFRGLARSVIGVAMEPAKRAYAPARPGSEIAEAASKLGLATVTGASVEAALGLLGKVAAAPMRIAITGSLHLVDAVIRGQAVARSPDGPSGNAVDSA